MKLPVAVIIISLATIANARTYGLDSASLCSSSTSNEQVYDWEEARVKLGRADYSSKSSRSRCEIKLYADVDFTDETRRLKIEVKTAKFDNTYAYIKVEIRDGSTSFSPLLTTLQQSNTYHGTYNTTQPYVYIVVDKSQCTSQSCREGLNVDLEVSNHKGVVSTDDDDELSTAGIIGIAVGACVGLVLLVAVPIGICFCCFAAASRRRHKANTAMATATTASNMNQGFAYPRQQYVVQGGNVTPYQPQAQYNMQAHQAGAPPSYPVAGQYPQQQGAGQYPQQPAGQYPQQPAGQYPQQPAGQYPQQPAGQYPQQPAGQYPQPEQQQQQQQQQQQHDSPKQHPVPDQQSTMM